MAVNNKEAGNLDLKNNGQIVASYSFEWRICDFSSKSTFEILESPSFCVGADGSMKWFLIAFPNGCEKDNEGYVSLFLHLVSSNAPKILTNFKLSILNKNRIKTHTLDIEYKFLQGQSYGAPKFIASKELYGLLTNDDKLTIVCDIDVYGRNEDKLLNIKEHFYQVLMSKQFSDVTLIVGDQEFKAHKTILAARSPVFSAMFSHAMEEANQSQIKITDSEPQVIQEMLHFIYTDNAPNINNVAEGLLAVADKYLLDSLTLMCADALYKNLSVTNAVKYLVLADLHSLSELKIKVIRFICEHAENVAMTDELNSLGKDLLSELFTALAVKNKYLR